MLPSFLTNLFWAQSQEGEGEETRKTGWSAEGALAVEHTASEEAGDWLLITTQQTPISLSPAHSNSVNHDCDGESVCSDSSWVITPAPVFQGSSLASPINPSHPLEDLLIEHPTMSVYHHHGDDNNLNEQTDAVSDTTNDHLQSNEQEPRDNNLNEQQQQNENNRELVLQQNRQRQQLALHMQLPLGGRRPVLRPPPPPPGAVYGLKPQQLTRRALKRQNVNSVRHGGGKIHQGNRVQKCSFKAGRRRC